MSTSTSLFVPVDLQAFCVGFEDVVGKDGSGYGTNNFANIAVDFGQLPSANGTSGPYLSALALASSSPFSNGGSAALQPGIHLHWALPDALTHGQSDKDGNIQFPQAPNRWLVVRVVKGDDAPDMAAWVVESDQLWDAKESSSTMSRAVPVKPSADNPTFKAMGKVAPWDNWAEPGSADAISKHTALGYGEVSYAAAYARSTNVFGFFDPLTTDGSTYGYDAGKPNQSWEFSYIVIGWYSEADQDPLSNLPAQTVAALETAYKWSFTPANGAAFPKDTFCHGMVTQLHWEPGSVYVTKPDASGIQVSIGNNTAEALSALLAKEMKQPSYEKLLNILQLDLLNELEEPGGLGTIDEKLHAANFSRTNAGLIWLVKRKDADKAQRSQTPSQKDISNSLLAAASSIDQPLPQDIAQKLDHLNTDQMAANRLEHQIETRQGQLFVDWYKFMVVEYPGSVHIGDPGILTRTEVLNYLHQEAQNIAGENYDGKGGLQKDLTGLQAKIVQEVTDLNNALKDLKMNLVNVPAPRYYQAADPVILFSGKQIQASPRYGRDGRFDKKGHLICRLDTQAVNAMQVQGGSTVTASELPLPNGPAAPPSQTPRINTLIAEALFTSPESSGFLATKAGNSGLQSAVASAQKNLLDGNRDQNHQITFTGLEPSPVGITDWGGLNGKNPWMPILLDWDVSCYPEQPIKFDKQGVAESYSSDFITHNYQPNDAAMPVELVPKSSQSTSEFQSYTGSTVLTSNVEIDLNRQINTLITNYPNDPNIDALKTIQTYLKTNPLPQQSQALSGFNEALIMREQVLQLPVFDPRQSSLLNRKFINEELPGIIDKENNEAPLPLNYYNPLRAGSMVISRLRIIDAFGQVLKIKDPETVIAKSLQPPKGIQDLAPINLPPRITQPSRLLFRWIAAQDDQVESNSHPVTTPIFGWVLFNHLDNSLAIYDAKGEAIGSFNRMGPVWQGAPGGGDYGQNDPKNALEALPNTPANSHLGRFVTGIYDKINSSGIGYLDAMLTAIDRTVTNVNPANAKQHAGLSVLMGRPLALTRATLTLELDGLPALNQSWSAFSNEVRSNTPYEGRDSGKFTDVNFPVQLGDLSKINDGMIGYFLTSNDDNDSSAYETFYAPAIANSDQTGHGVIAPDFDHLLLKPTTGYPPVQGNDPNKIYLSLIVDPRAPIHATTGILPTKQIDIPPDFYARALQRMSVTFLTAPVISSGDKLSLPTPTEPGYEWSWVNNTGTAWNTSDQIASVNTRATFSYPPQFIQEGWLSLKKRKPKS